MTWRVYSTVERHGAFAVESTLWTEDGPGATKLLVGGLPREVAEMQAKAAQRDYDLVRDIGMSPVD